MPLQLDKQVAPLLAKVSHLELKLRLGELALSFPVRLHNSFASQWLDNQLLDSHLFDSKEQAHLSAPHIFGPSGHARAWRLSAPQHIQLKYANDRPLAAEKLPKVVEIRDLSTNGMRLLSPRPLFSPKQPHSKTLLLQIADETLRCEVSLVRQHKGAAFWLTALQFQLNNTDQRSLSDFVFQGFLAQLEKKQAP